MKLQVAGDLDLDSQNLSHSLETRFLALPSRNMTSTDDQDSLGDEADA